MAAISGIKLTSPDEPKGPAGVGTGDPGNDPWYGPKAYSSSPDSTTDYQSSVAPSTTDFKSSVKPHEDEPQKPKATSRDNGEVSADLSKHKRTEVKSPSVSDQLGKINLRTGINSFGEVGGKISWLVTFESYFIIIFILSFWL